MAMTAGGEAASALARVARSTRLPGVMTLPSPPTISPRCLAKAGFRRLARDRGLTKTAMDNEPLHTEPTPPEPFRFPPDLPMARGGTSVSADGETGSKVMASGKLAERPLPRLIQQLFRKRVTGCLVVTDDSGDESQVFLR